MEGLSSEVLLPVFENLDSYQMMQIIRVCKRWQEIINENSKLWRKCVSPIKRNKWKSSLKILRLFDRKSKSRLREVSMHVNFKSDEVESFLLLLEKSKESLRTLHLFGGAIDVQRALSDLCWKLNSLIDCRICQTDDPNISFKQARNEEDQIQDFRSYSSRLKILWTTSTKSLVQELKETHQLDHLSSLRLEELISPAMLIPILGRNLQTLKHLRIRLMEHMASENLPKLDLPHLEVFDIQSQATTFPSWLTIPSSTIVIHRNNQLLWNLPSISRILLFAVPPNIRDLKDCQGLTEIRFTSAKIAKYGSFGSDLIAMCRYHALKTLVIPFEHLNESQLLQLKEVVAEVIDFKTFERRIEVEI